MLRILIVDDEPHARNVVRNYLIKTACKIDWQGEASNVEEAITSINQNKPNLVFLDIQLGKRLGFEILEAIEERTFKVIFCTAYDNYAIKAIKAKAENYLLKPMDFEEFESAFFDAIKSFKSESNNSNNKQIEIRTAKETVVLFPDQIYRIEADSNYSEIYTSRGKLVVSKTLKFLQEELLDPEIFVRCHQSHVINKHHVLSVLAGQKIKLADESIVPVSRKYKETISSLLL